MRQRTALVFLLISALALPQLALAARTQVKPGWNMISRQQEVQLGREAAMQAERQLPVVRDAALNNYVNELGRRLARHSTAPGYPYTFKVVADKSINAFALPGGPVYVNSGTIAATGNEAQLAGVLAHEIAHVALRHGTSNASKAMLAQFPLAILGGLLGSGSVAGQLAQLGIGFGVNSIFLKYSRDAERQADILGTQILYDAGYDPEEMARFFEKLQRSERSRSVEFLSDHPNPGNRVELVRKEMANLGEQKRLVDYGPGFDQAKTRATGVSAQAPGRRADYGHEPSDQHRHPSYPSGEFRTLDAGWFRMAHPGNWNVYGQETSALTIAPQEGIARSREGTSGLALGAMISVYEPEGEEGRVSFSDATAQLAEQLRHTNPGLRQISGRQQITVDGRQAVSMTFMGRSPVRGENEIDWLVTAQRPDGTLWYVVFVAPERDFSAMRPTFDRMLDSVQFAQ